MPKGFEMRPLLKTLAVSCFIVSPAWGQTPQATMQTPPVTSPGNTPPVTSPTMPPAPPPMPPAPSTGMAPADSNAATPPAKPSSWNGTDAEWATHVRNCQKSHSNYDPATNQYRTSSGATRTCTR